MFHVSLSFAFRNLYKSQKLLTVGIESQLPLWPLPGLKDSRTEENSNDILTYRSEMPENESNLTYYPAIMLLLLLSVVVYTACRFHKSRSRPRKRKSRLKKMLSVINSSRVPAV